MHCWVGVPAGVYLPRGCTFLGVYLPGGVPARGVPAGGGVPAWGVPAGGVPVQGGVPAQGGYLPRYSPLWTEWQTGAKILPCPKLRLRAVIIEIKSLVEAAWSKFWDAHWFTSGQYTILNQNHTLPRTSCSRLIFKMKRKGKLII